MIEVKELVPHSGQMLLIDEIVSRDQQKLVARTTIREASPFYRAASGVPSWVGLEYMAQTVAAWSGLRARERGEEPGPGFLIGAKKYKANQPAFPLGSQLEIEARLRDQHGSLGVFECRITSGEIESHGVLSVYEGEVE